MKKRTSTITITGKAANAAFNALLLGHNAQQHKDIAMTTRVKPIAYIPAIVTLEEADAALARIAARKRELDLLDLGLKEDVDRLKLICAEQGEPIKQDIATVEQGLLRFAETHKEELFSKKKSRELTFGTFGFRASSILKTLKRAITWDRVLGTLEERGMTSCIRTKKEVDKEALRQLSPDKLTEVGCKLVQEDAFYYEIAETALAGTDSAA